jgi:hypothetical protein
MAEDSPSTGKENSGHPEPLPGEIPVTDGVDAAVDGVKPATLESVTDRMPPEPGAYELCSADYPVLTLSEIGNEPIGFKTVDHCTHNRLKCSLVLKGTSPGTALAPPCRVTSLRSKS